VDIGTPIGGLWKLNEFHVRIIPVAKNKSTGDLSKILIDAYRSRCILTPMTTITISIEDVTAEAIRTKCEEQGGRSVSSFIREAITKSLNDGKGEE
jgi:hypothetical protein